VRGGQESEESEESERARERERERESKVCFRRATGREVLAGGARIVSGRGLPRVRAEGVTALAVC